MRKIITSTFITLDGFVSGPNGEMDWNTEIFNDEMGKEINEFQKDIDTILLGRVTYQEFAGYWPTQGPKDDAALAEHMNTTPKVVFSRSLDTAEWQNTTLIKDNIAASVLRLKLQPGKNLGVIGSPNLIQSLTNLGLIDEYRLLVHPTLLGSGKPLFQDLKNMNKLKLVKSKTFKNGVLALTYKFA